MLCRRRLFGWMNRRVQWRNFAPVLLGVYLLGMVVIQRQSRGRIFQDLLPDVSAGNPIGNASLTLVMPSSSTVTRSLNNSLNNPPAHNGTAKPLLLIHHDSHVNMSAQVEEIQRRRQRVLREVCAKEPWSRLNTKQLQWSRVDESLRTIYCGIPKCGTTSWTAMALDLHGEHNAPLTDHWTLMAKHGIKFLHRYRPQDAMTKLNSYYKYVFVRHPLEKLLSAWKDKLAQKSEREYFHNTMGRQIIRKYRKNPSRESLAKGDDTTFPEFVKYVIDVVGRGKNVDQHIGLMHRQCQPCAVHYDFIGKMETLAEDAEHVLHKAYHVGTSHSLPVQNRAGIASSNNITAFYYAQVPPEDIARLREIYRLDIELFDYLPTIPGTNL